MVPPIVTIADALVARQPGTLALEVVRKHVADVITVSEDELLAATRVLASEMKLVVEPGGAVAVAAVMTGKLRSAAGPGRTVAILSGGNVSLTKLAGWVEGGEPTVTA